MSDMPNNPASETVRGLLKHGWGHASFELGADGELRELQTVITVKQLPNEPIEHFVERLRTQHGMQRGDVVEFIANGGRLDIAKITKAPRC